MSFLSLESMTIYPAREVQIALLLIKEVIMSTRYTDFADVFSKKSVKVLPKTININNHTIKFVDSKQPLYELMYNLNLIELETLKTYIQTNLANGFIQPSKFLVRVPILFV